jgi:hypothetical protein
MFPGVAETLGRAFKVRIGAPMDFDHPLKITSPKGKDHLKDQGVDGRMGSKWTLGRLVEGVWSGFTWLRIGVVGGLL